MELPQQFLDFLKTCSEMELIALQREARLCGDQATVSAALNELGDRQKVKPKAEASR